MARIERVSCFHGPTLPSGFGPLSDLAILDLDRLPPMPSLAAWAAEAGVPVVVGGRAPVDGLRVGVLLTGSGRLAGWQAQTHRAPDAADPPLLRDELTVFDVEGVRVALLVGQDAEVPEVGRALALMGADLLIGLAQPDLAPLRSPLWRMVQQNQVLGVLAGPDPALLLPCEAHAEATGYMAFEPIGQWHRADLPWAAWRVLRQQDALLSQLNPDVYLSNPWPPTPEDVGHHA
jgi:hypothetical protein